MCGHNTGDVVILHLAGSLKDTYSVLAKGAAYYRSSDQERKRSARKIETTGASLCFGYPLGLGSPSER
jgi:hypothetical protein